jgi:hypothetical protein
VLNDQYGLISISIVQALRTPSIFEQHVERPLILHPTQAVARFAGNIKYERLLGRLWIGLTSNKYIYFIKPFGSFSLMPTVLDTFSTVPSKTIERSVTAYVRGLVSLHIMFNHVCVRILQMQTMTSPSQITFFPRTKKQKITERGSSSCLPRRPCRCRRAVRHRDGECRVDGRLRDVARLDGRHGSVGRRVLGSVGRSVVGGDFDEGRFPDRPDGRGDVAGLDLLLGRGDVDVGGGQGGGSGEGVVGRLPLGVLLSRRGADGAVFCLVGGCCRGGGEVGGLVGCRGGGHADGVCLELGLFLGCRGSHADGVCHVLDLFLGRGGSHARVFGFILRRRGGGGDRGCLVFNLFLGDVCCFIGGFIGGCCCGVPYSLVESLRDRRGYVFR